MSAVIAFIVENLSFLAPLFLALLALLGIGGMKMKAKSDGKNEAEVKINNETNKKTLKAFKRAGKVRDDVDNVVDFDNDERVRRVREKYGMGKNKRPY